MMLRALRAVLLSAALASALSGCSGTLDSLGSDGSASAGSAGALGPLRLVNGPKSYPNAFKTFLNVSDAEVSTRLDDAFNQLFLSTGFEETIYYQWQTSDEYFIQDVLHGDIRTEGMGLALIITLELDRQTEFDRLWRYAKAEMLQKNAGPGRGYYRSRCDDDPITPCLDTYGMQHFALALILANRYWANSASAPGYAEDALALLEVLKNGDGTPFDPATHLVREQPMLAATDYTRTALEMPAAYDLWYQATGDVFWRDAATAARRHLVRSAHGKTGLWPIRSNTSNGAPASSAGFVSPGYTAQGYRTQLNLALDAAWGTAGADQAAVADRLLAFFDQASNNHDLTSYGANFTVDGALTLDDGVTLDPDAPVPSQALISVNGALVIAASATTDANRQLRHDFVNAVWQQDIPSGKNRYYEGLLYMMSMLIMGGQLQVHVPAP